MNTKNSQAKTRQQATDKEKSVFEELLSKYTQYADRKAAKIEMLTSAIENCEKELSVIQRKFANEVSTMTPEEYKANKQRMDELFDDIELYNEQKDILEKRPGTTSEEYQEWQETAENEINRIKAEVEAETYRLLTQLVELYEKDITAFEKMRLLIYSFEGAVGNRKQSFDVADKVLPPYVNCICRVLLIYFNELDEKLNNGEHKTKCYDTEIVSETLSEISQIGRRLGFPQVKELNVPSWDEAWHEIKYDKPWSV